MKVRLGISSDNTWDIPDGLVTLKSERAKRDFMPSGDELRLDLDDARDMAALFTHANPVGREYLFQALLRAIERPGTYWRVRSAAIEFIRRQTYQPAIRTLTKLALTECLERIYEVVPVLAELRADASLVAIAVKKEDPDLTGDILEEIVWVPTRRAFELMRYSKARKPYIRQVEQIERWGDAVLDVPKNKIEQFLMSVQTRQTISEKLKNSLGLSEEAQVAWESSFLYWNALSRDKRVHILDFVQGIVEVRDELLEARRSLSPENQFDRITEINEILHQAVDQISNIRRYPLTYEM